MYSTFLALKKKPWAVWTVLFFAHIQCVSASAQELQTASHKHFDTSLSFEQRTKELVSMMTIEEKVSQLSHGAAAIPRLGIPKYNWWNGSLHGVAFSGKATVFPQPIGLAASFNEDLLHDIATAISDEARAKHHTFVSQGKREIFQGLTFFAPNINIFRDPRWGRGSETYGEDPWLSRQLGIAYIKGLQGDDERYLKLVATAKHYAVHSGPEATRHSFNSIVSDKDLFETYMPAFKGAVEEAHVYSIMGAYNRVNGASASGDVRLLTEILREQWGFNGYTVSDCWAVRDIYEHHKIAWSAENATQIALQSGLDLNCGNYYQDYLLQAYKDGLVSEADVDLAVYRTMLARFKLGMFDPEHMVPWSDIPFSVINSEKHQQLALEAAQQSIVLLQNKTQGDNAPLLPIDTSIHKKILVVGPNAHQIEALLGNYHGLPFQYSTPLMGIQKRASGAVTVDYAYGSNWNDSVAILEDLDPQKLHFEIAGKRVQGLQGKYFSNSRLQGNPDGRVDQESPGAAIIFENEPEVTRIDPIIKFDWDEESPHNMVNDDFFSILWEGKLTFPKSGKFLFGAEGHNKFKIYINGKLHVEHYEGYHENIKVAKPYQFEKDKAYDLRIEFEAHTGAANFRLMWADTERDLLAEAREKAKEADLILVFAGLTPRLEAEGYDRTSIDLPAEQSALIQAMHATGKPVVLTVLNGGHLALNWEKENLHTIVEAWYPGQAAGDAIASVLFGDYNPSGRLPLTFVPSLDGLPHFGNYDMKGRTYRYSLDAALWPFGYGMSYSTFDYSGFELEVDSDKKELVASVDLKNTSSVEGTEVVQLYVKKQGVLNQPLRSLKAVQRMTLGPAKTQRITLRIPYSDLIWFDDNGNEQQASGDYQISIGGGQPQLTAPTTTTLTKGISF